MQPVQTEQTKLFCILLVAIPLLLLAISPFFFFSGPDYYSIRSLQAFWKLGHIFYFALLSYWMYLLSLRKNISPGHVFVFCLVFTLLLGSAIEVLQHHLNNRAGGHPSDVLRDMTGVFFTFFFLVREPLLRGKKIIYTARILTLALLLAFLADFAQSLADEAIARWQFPFLSGMETPFELSRWRTVSARVSEEVAREGKKSLKVPLFGTGQGYVDIVLSFFPNDWSQYRSVHWSVYNPLKQDMPLACRIHDRQHKKSGYETTDRFNTEFVLHPGWNDLAASLDAVKKAPKSRKMDMTHIEELHFFTAKSPEHQYLYFDKVYLTP